MVNMASINVLDSLYEMFFSMRDRKTSLTTFSGSNLMSSDKIFQYFPYDHCPLSESKTFAVESTKSRYSFLDNIIFHQNFNRVLDHRVKSDITKLSFSQPVLKFVEDCFRGVSYVDMLLESETSLENKFRPFCKPVVTPLLNQNEVKENKEMIEIGQVSLPLSVPHVEVNMKVTQNCANIDPRVEESSMRSKCNMAITNTLNQELANRKTKELHKRSKKRRRRQKKVISANLKAESCQNPMLTKSAEKKLSAPVKSELICDKSNIKPRTSDPKNGSSDFHLEITVENCVSGVQIVMPDLSSFCISLETRNGEDCEWDTDSGSDCLSETTEFELSGLFMSNLSASNTHPCQATSAIPELNRVTLCPDDLNELRHLEYMLCKVNKSWNDSTQGIEKKTKLPTKVSFAPDHELVAVVPVEMYERKGEWEMYASERLRFKRRIDELEKIISPCLTKEHREKIFRRIQQSEL